MAVLFNSVRPLYRCENLTAIWNAYQEDKTFKQYGYGDLTKSCRDFPVVVTDEFIRNKVIGQKIIMIAHGLTGGKLYGIDQPHGQFKPQCCRLTNYYITSSEYGRKFAASAAGIPIDRCLALGMPRTDNYINKQRGDGGTFLAKSYNRVYLYLPTFRAKYNKPTPKINYEYLNSLLEEDELFVVKRHMISKKKILPHTMSNIYEVDSMEITTPYLLDCDVVVTDFSSVMFDAHFLNKPVVLTADENDEYLISRGMYMNYPYDYSSRAIAVEGNEKKLVALMRDAALNGMTDVELQCRERTSGACDGHSSERVVKLIKDIINET